MLDYGNSFLGLIEVGQIGHSISFFHSYTDMRKEWDILAIFFT